MYTERRLQRAGGRLMKKGNGAEGQGQVKNTKHNNAKDTESVTKSFLSDSPKTKNMQCR